MSDDEGRRTPRRRPRTAAELQEQLRATRREREARLWAAYKPGYERYLKPATTQEAP